MNDEKRQSRLKSFWHLCSYLCGMISVAKKTQCVSNLPKIPFITKLYRLKQAAKENMRSAFEYYVV